MSIDVLEAIETAEADDPYARVRAAMRFNPARNYTFAEARLLMFGADVPDDQMPTENWLSRQAGLGNFVTVQYGRARYLTGELILQLIEDHKVGQYGLPVNRKK